MQEVVVDAIDVGDYILKLWRYLEEIHYFWFKI